MSDGKVTLIETILLSGFAGLGGLLSYLLRTLNRDEIPSPWKGLLELMSSAFVGLLAMLACKALEVDILWSGVIAGVFGWLGAEASIVMLSSLIKKKLGIGDAKDS